MDVAAFLEHSVYFLALINPASKIFVLATLDPPLAWRELRTVTIRSTCVAFLILCVLTLAGNVILQKVFHVELYSLKAAGGIILFLVGLSAVQQGRFYDKASFRMSDISVVPLAAPLIAGPGTITAAISLSASLGIARTLPALTMALLVNLLLMLMAHKIGRALERINATGPLIRITGLIVASVSAQMVFSGVAEWLRQIHAGGAPLP